MAVQENKHFLKVLKRLTAYKPSWSARKRLAFQKLKWQTKEN